RAHLTGEELDLTTAVAALERTGPVVVEERRRALHAAVEVGVGVGPRVALLERRLLTLRGAALEPADEPRQVGPAEQRHHERDEPHDADASAHRDAALGTAAHAAPADVGVVVERHGSTLVRRRACGEISGVPDAASG